jgi:MFS family permease
VPLPRSLAPFRQRDYARFWAGAFVSNIGTWMETVAVGILVTTETGQAGWAGLVSAAAFFPAATAGLVGGALADRIPRRRLLLMTVSAQMLLAGLLTALAAVDAAHPAVVTVIVFAAGCAAALGFPTYQALLPDLVPREDVPAAMALGSAQWNLGRVVGPALAGVVIAFGGYTWAFAINALSFLAVIAAIAPLALPAPSPKAGESIRASIASGFRYVRGDPGLRAVVGYLSLNSLLAAPFIALVPAVALKVFGDEDFGTSLLVTAQGVGAVVMALTLGGLSHRFGIRRVVLVGLSVLPALLVAYALAPTIGLAAAAIFGVGAAYLACLSGFNTVAQLRAPTEMRGRVMSVNMLILGTLYPIGAVVQGRIADSVGLRTTTTVAAALLALGIVGQRLLRPGSDRLMGPPEAVELLTAATGSGGPDPDPVAEPVAERVTGPVADPVSTPTNDRTTIPANDLADEPTSEEAR